MNRDERFVWLTVWAVFFTVPLICVIWWLI